MTYGELYESATRKLEESEINLGEYEEMMKPLNEDVRTWIPVSERLPEETGKLDGYLVSIGDWVGIATFVNGKFWNNYFWQTLFEFPVEAWMPLPESYEAGGAKE